MPVKDEILFSSFIGPTEDVGTCALVLEKRFEAGGGDAASLQITAKGVYAAEINGRPVGDFFLAPGWTEYFTRIQYQTYDVTELIRPGENVIRVTVGWGWFFHRIYGQSHSDLALIAALVLRDGAGGKTVIPTDESWDWGTGPWIYDDFYKGETYDANRDVVLRGKAAKKPFFCREIVPQQGEILREQERLPARRVFVTPRGETVIDFGQNLAGHVEFRVAGRRGETVVLRHAEVLDRDGNFYLDNLRAADNRVTFVCDGKPHVFKTRFTYQGFRYVRLEGFSDEIRPEDFTAVAVWSDMKRTGRFACGEPLLERLYENQLWGQRGNYVDIPTDCPQRDERQGWVGDARMFLRAGCYNYDTDRFFRKWLRDLKYGQALDGRVPTVSPLMDFWWDPSRAPTGDSMMAVSYMPWQLYLMYGDKEILREMFEPMRLAADWIRGKLEDGLWQSDVNFGDWLALDGEPDSYTGATPGVLIYNAFAIYGLRFTVKTCEVLGCDAAGFRTLYDEMRRAYVRRFIGPDGRMTVDTQSACVYTLAFGLADDPAPIAAQHRELIARWGRRTTGMGSPYDLHALSENGNGRLAWDLLLSETYPSWLYAVKAGATTMWEHWDGIRPDGTMWDPAMNSFNHHACGAVGDWLYGRAAGILPDETAPGFARTLFRPLPDERVGWLSASLETRFGMVRSGWRVEDGAVAFDLTVPEGTTGLFDACGVRCELTPGRHRFSCPWRAE